MIESFLCEHCNQQHTVSMVRLEPEWDVVLCPVTLLASVFLPNPITHTGAIKPHVQTGIRGPEAPAKGINDK